jgi:hypothetical protein
VTSLRNVLSGFRIPVEGRDFSESVEITNKMKPGNRIYYSNVYWRLNMFRAAHRSSSGALNCICSLWFTYTCGDRPLSSLSRKWISSDVPLETCWAFNKRWNNKFYYKVSFCWLFLLIHTTMHGSMNIKFRDFPIIQIDQTGCSIHPAFFALSNSSPFQGWGGRSVKLNTHPPPRDLVARYRMSRVIPPFFLYTAMA